MRKSTVFLAAGAVVVLAFAGLLRFVIVPGLQQLPDDLDTTLHYTGKADILDQAALLKGDMANGFKTGVPVTLEQRVRVVSSHGQTVVVTAPVIHELGGPPSRDDRPCRGPQLVHQLGHQPGLLDRLPGRSEPVVQPVVILAAEVVVGIGDVPVERHRHEQH